MHMTATQLTALFTGIEMFRIKTSVL